MKTKFIETQIVKDVFGQLGVKYTYLSTERKGQRMVCKVGVEGTNLIQLIKKANELVEGGYMFVSQDARFMNWMLVKL